MIQTIHFGGSTRPHKSMQVQQSDRRSANTPYLLEDVEDDSND